jgi:hypothetical protein
VVAHSILLCTNQAKTIYCYLGRVLEEAVLRSKEIRSGFYCPMSDPAILYVGYGLPFKVLNTGSQPLYNLLTGSSHHSRLSIESEIRPLCRTVFHRSSLLTSLFFNSNVTPPLWHICQLSVQQREARKLKLMHCAPEAG